jgi:hypothetical protein
MTLNAYFVCSSISGLTKLIYTQFFASRKNPDIHNTTVELVFTLVEWDGNDQRDPMAHQFILPTKFVLIHKNIFDVLWLTSLMLII